MPKKKRKSRKPRLWKWWYKKIDRDMGKLVRERGYCEMCGSRTNRLNWSHVISRSNKTLRWDILNALCLCSHCHQYKWHDSPIESAKWFREKYPNRYEYLLKAKNIIIERTEDDYRQIREAIKNKNIKRLYIPLDKLL